MWKGSAELGVCCLILQAQYTIRRCTGGNTGPSLQPLCEGAWHTHSIEQYFASILLAIDLPKMVGIKRREVSQLCRRLREAISLKIVYMLRMNNYLDFFRFI